MPSVDLFPGHPIALLVLSGPLHVLAAAAQLLFLFELVVLEFGAHVFVVLEPVVLVFAALATAVHELAEPVELELAVLDSAAVLDSVAVLDSAVLDFVVLVLAAAQEGLVLSQVATQFVRIPLLHQVILHLGS